MITGAFDSKAVTLTYFPRLDIGKAVPLEVMQRECG